MEDNERVVEDAILARSMNAMSISSDAQTGTQPQAQSSIVSSSALPVQSLALGQSYSSPPSTQQSGLPSSIPPTQTLGTTTPTDALGQRAQLQAHF